jgi:hypothetical protein
MKITTVAFFTLYLFLSINAFADIKECEPEVENNQVFVEVLNAEGEVISAKAYNLTHFLGYTGTISTDESSLIELSANNVNLSEKKKAKFFFKTVGQSVVATYSDGSVIARIGGCPKKILKLMLPENTKDAPFIYSGLVGLDSKSLEDKKKKSNESNSVTTNEEDNPLSQSELDNALRKEMNKQHKPVKYQGPGVARCSKKKGDLYVVTAIHKGTSIKLEAIRANGKKNQKAAYKGNLILNKKATAFVHRKNFAKIGKENDTGHFVIHGSFFDKGCEVAFQVKRNDKKYTSLK